MGVTNIAWTDKTDRAKWCTRCKAIHSAEAFGKDRTRGDGLSASCLASRRVKVRQKPGYAKGAYSHGWIVPARPGDKRQARRRVNYLVEQKRIPLEVWRHKDFPEATPCV